MFQTKTLTRMSLAIKLGRMKTYLDGLLPMKTHDP